MMTVQEESDLKDSNRNELDVLDLSFNEDSMFEFFDFSEKEKDDEFIQNNFVFVDIQGFKTYCERFICKEFCLVSDDKDDFYHAIVKSPYAFEKVPSFYKRQVKWLTKHIHGLTYNCGDVHMIPVIQDTYAKLMKKIVIVKGVEKVKWIKHIYRNCGEIDCINFEDLDVDTNLEKIHSNMCDYHLRKTFSNLNLNESEKHRKRIAHGWPEYRCAKTIVHKMKEAVKKSNFSYNI